MDYHSDYESVSKTMLNLFCQSRLEYYHTYVTREMPPKSPRRPMLVGTVLHGMLLEGRPFEDYVLPYPDDCLNVNGGLIGKRAAAFRGENAGVVCLKQDECDEILAVVDGVLADDKLGAIIAEATQREQRVDATVNGVPCRCKPDILCDLGDRIVVYDLKFSQLVDPASFSRSNRRLRYWLQDAHYSRVLGERFSKPVQFRFCVVEIQFPFRCQWYWLDIASRQVAFDAHEKLLADLRECQLTGDWSDKWANEVVLSPWDVDNAPDDLVEIEE